MKIVFFNLTSGRTLLIINSKIFMRAAFSLITFFLFVTILFTSCTKDEPELLPLTVATVTPANNSTGIEIPQTVTITFSRKVGAAQSNLSGVKIIAPDGSEVQSNKALDTGGLIVKRIVGRNGTIGIVTQNFAINAGQRLRYRLFLHLITARDIQLPIGPKM